MSTPTFFYDNGESPSSLQCFHIYSSHAYMEFGYFPYSPLHTHFVKAKKKNPFSYLRELWDLNMFYSTIKNWYYDKKYLDLHWSIMDWKNNKNYLRFTLIRHKKIPLCFTKILYIVEVKYQTNHADIKFQKYFMWILFYLLLHYSNVFSFLSLENCLLKVRKWDDLVSEG